VGGEGGGGGGGGGRATGFRCASACKSQTANSGICMI